MLRLTVQAGEYWRPVFDLPAGSPIGSISNVTADGRIETLVFESCDGYSVVYRSDDAGDKIAFLRRVSFSPDDELTRLKDGEEFYFMVLTESMQQSGREPVQARLRQEAESDA